MPFYESFVFEQLRQVGNSKCHHCGDVYLCIKCQKDILCLHGTSPSSIKSCVKDEKSHEYNVVDRVAQQSKGFVISILHTLAKYGFCVVDNLVPLALAENTLEEIQKSYDTSGNFAPGKLSNGALNRISRLKDIRGDSVMWLDGSNHDYVCVSQVAKQMNKLALSLYHANGIAMNRVSKSKVMVSCYDGDGKGYKKHIDSPRDDSLKLTFIYYLNKNYEKRHGGCLRIHTNSKSIDVSPEFGKLVIFRSDSLVHEVLPSYIRRFAFTTWYMEVPKRKALRSADELQQETDKFATETAPKICLYGKRIKIEPVSEEE